MGQQWHNPAPQSRSRLFMLDRHESFVASQSVCSTALLLVAVLASRSIGLRVHPNRPWFCVESAPPVSNSKATTHPRTPNPCTWSSLVNATEKGDVSRNLSKARPPSLVPTSQHHSPVLISRTLKSSILTDDHAPEMDKKFACQEKAPLKCGQSRTPSG